MGWHATWLPRSHNGPYPTCLHQVGSGLEEKVQVCTDLRADGDVRERTACICMIDGAGKRKSDLYIVSLE